MAGAGSNSWPISSDSVTGDFAPERRESERAYFAPARPLLETPGGKPGGEGADTVLPRRTAVYSPKERTCV